MLEIEGVSVAFGGLTALKEFDFRVGDGELVGLIGPNGAGKSTAFNTISGIYPPSLGEIRFGGESLIGLAPYQIARRGIARTFQNIRLFPDMSALENIEVAMHQRRGYGLRDAIFRTQRFSVREAAIAEKAA